MNNTHAILIECDPHTTLGGSCLRDVRNMATHLIDRCSFVPNNIHILTTHNNEPIKGNMYADIQYKSSRTDIFKVYNDITARNPMKIIILLSGHGFSVRDNNNDEIDGRDEAINVGRRIIDDELYDGIVKECKCDLILLTDTCHSGTMFDLNYCYKGDGKWIKSTKRNSKLNYKSKIISLSACNDNQLSMCDVGDDTGFGGSLTTAILNIPDVLEDLIKINNVENAYEKVRKSLRLLNQTVLLSKMN
jgi:Caspase domain